MSNGLAFQCYKSPSFEPSCTLGMIDIWHDPFHRETFEG